jgi:archaellum biogenesis ATPase FlaH
MNKNLEVALQYASWGWHVLPVQSNSKVPDCHKGVHEATNDINKITAWFANNPDLNVGVAAGKISNIIVFDIDPRNGGEESFAQWCKEYGVVPDGVMQLTAGGGYHHIARYQENIRSCKLADGIDLLSDGRYFLAYPSKINDKSYQWEGSSDPFDGVVPFEIPNTWLYGMQVRRAMHKERIQSTSANDIIEGGRNDALTSLAGSMRHIGMTAKAIFEAINATNNERCSPPLPHSEIVQIVNSVCRYESDTDLALTMALGTESANLLLAKYADKDSDYFLTQATSYISQPSPINWIIRHWLPSYSVAMLFGESGVGKSFIALDMACSIATGKDWHGIKTKQGKVVYMAGEGNYGMRQRIASWCKKHSIYELDNLYISNRAIDLDDKNGNAALKVIDAVREITENDVSLVIIDTLNNHMFGDENKAQDTRDMIMKAKIIGEELKATVCFVHHSGVSEDAKHRLRGSSAWKGALDTSILVKRAGSKDDNMIGVICDKMKDAEKPVDIYGSLEYVNIGWRDDENEEIKGACFVVDASYEPKNIEKKDSKVDLYFKDFTSAWLSVGKPLDDEGYPWITKSALREYLIKSKRYASDASVEANLKPSDKNKFINTLLLAEILDVIYSQDGKKNVVLGFKITNDYYANSIKLL